MPSGGTMEDENDGPPFDKGGLQGGLCRDRIHLPLAPSLCKEGRSLKEIGPSPLPLWEEK